MPRNKVTLSTLALLISFALIIGGCSSDKANSGGEAASKSPDTKKQMEISVAQWDAAGWETSENDTWLKELGERFNVTFKKNALTWDDWQSKVRLWAASGQLPDLFVHDENYHDWVNQGMFKPIPVEKLNEYPYIKQYIKDSVLEALTVEGKIYSIPRAHWTKAADAMALNAIYVQKSFLEKAGLTEPPDTLAGWHDFLKKAVDEDFSGTGKTFGLKASSLLLSLPFTQTANAWVEEDGKWIPQAFSKTHIEELKFSRQLFQEGILDPDFAVRKLEDERKLFQQGRMAVIEANGDPDMLDMQVTSDMNGVTADQYIKLALPPKAEDGNRYFLSTLNYWSYTGISPKVSDEKLERILEILNFLGSPEGQLLSSYGRAGIDYKSKDGTAIDSIDQADHIESLLPVDEKSGKAKTLLDAFPSSGFGRFFLSWNTWVTMTNPAHSPEVRKMSLDYFDSLRKETTIIEPNLNIEFLSTPEKNKMPNLGALYNELYVQAVMSDKDVETMFNDWVKEQTKKVSAAIKEVNDAVK